MKETLGGNIYDQAVIQFVEDKDGEILVVSDDQFFYKMVQSVFLKTLAVKKNCVFSVQQQETALKRIREKVDESIPLVLILERVIRDKSSSELLFSVHKLYPDIKILILTDEIDQRDAAHLHESGATSVLTKPASIKDIIEKLAFLVKPPEKLSMLMDKGKALLAGGQAERVLGICEKILAIKPGSPAALMLQGDAYLAMEQWEKAVASYTGAHESSPLFLKPIEKLAAAYKEYDQKNHLAYLLKLDKLSPLNIKRKFEIGKAFTAKGDLAKAERHFDAALEHASKNDVSITDTIAKSIVDTLAPVSPALSSKYFKLFVKFKGKSLSTQDINVINRLGISLRRQSMWEEAIDHYELAMSAAPDDFSLHYNMGMAYSEGRRFQEAATHFRKALELEPSLPDQSREACLSMAAAFEEAGSDGQALALYKRALEHAPGDKETRRLVEILENRSSSPSGYNF